MSTSVWETVSKCTESEFRLNTFYFQIYIEFCGGGAVDGIMIELEKPLTEPQIRCICKEMLQGLQFLHRNKVIHRDIKAGNVLLTGEGEVKLGQYAVLFLISLMQ